MKSLLSLSRRAQLLLALLLGLAFLAGAAGAWLVFRPTQMLYVPVREGTIRAQAETFPKRQAVMIGDSRTDLLYLGRIRRHEVLNAGVGGSRVADWLDDAPDLIARTDPAEVIVALGVNDARRDDMPTLDQWRADYRRLIGTLGGGGRCRAASGPAGDSRRASARARAGDRGGRR